MPLFDPKARLRSPDHARVWAMYEIAYTAVDFCAAALFVIGSILFFWEETTVTATWMFLVGSVFFGLKPTISLLRELKFLRLGEVDKLAERGRQDF